MLTHILPIIRFISADIAAVITALFFLVLPQLQFDYNFERFFPIGDEDTDFFLQHRKQFTTDNDFVFIAIENKVGVFEQDFLQRVDSLTNMLKTLPEVTSVTSPTNITHPVRDQFIGQVFQIPWLRFNEPENYALDSAKIYESGQLVPVYFSEDAKAIAINLQTTQYLSKAKCDTLADQLVAMTSLIPFDDMHIAGRSVGQSYYVDIMQRELVVFVLTSLVLIVLFLFIAFRSWWGIWVPLVVIMLSVIWIMGLMTATGKRIDVMANILPTILFVVGMSDVVHIIAKYLEEIRDGANKRDALSIAIREIGLATFLTSVTTSVGFFTLLITDIIPIREFGFYTAIGVFMAYMLAYSILPPVLELAAEPKMARIPSGYFWRKLLHKTFAWVLRRRVLIGLISLLFLGLSLAGIYFVKVDNFLLEDLNVNDPVRQDFNYFEENFSGVRPFDMGINVEAEGADLFSPEVIQAVDTIEQFLKNEYGIGFIVTPLTYLKGLNQANHGGKAKFFRLPQSERALKKMAKELKRFGKHPDLKSLSSPDFRNLRVMGKMGDLGAKEIKRRNESLDGFIARAVPPELISYRITGTATLVDKNSDFVVVNMIEGLLIAFGVVVLIIGLLFRSIKMVVIGLVPNILPLLIIGGIMGATGIRLHFSTAIIFTIAFGIAVDDSIHFLMKLKLELRKGRSLPYAIKRTFISTGKAIIVTTLILCGGFLTLIFSSFMGTYYIGLLISLTMLFAVLADLFLLPVLLLWFGRGIK